MTHMLKLLGKALKVVITTLHEEKKIFWSEWKDKSYEARNRKYKGELNENFRNKNMITNIFTT